MVRGPLKGFLADVLLDGRTRERGVFRMEGVERAIRTEGQFGRQLWGMLCLELWFRAFMDGDALPESVAATAEVSSV